MKKIIAIVILIMLVGFFIWNQRASFEDPIGTYINESNVRDTICLFSTGRFEQVVYDKAGRLIYHCKSKWRKTSHGIAIDSILLYDNLSSLNLSGRCFYILKSTIILYLLLSTFIELT